MAGKKGPDLTNPDENPGYETHVQNVQDMAKSASPGQRVAGIGWYRKAATDVAHIATGLHPGQMTDHPNSAWAERGITQDKPGTSPSGSAFIRNQLANTQGHESDHAASLGSQQAEDYARTGRYQGQRGSAVNDAGRPFGRISHSPAIHDIAVAMAAFSPAGPTGMDWSNNPRAVADSRHLSDDQFQNIARANTYKPGTPERKAASEIAREPFKGTAINHQTTQNVEKGMRAMRGEYRGQENPLGIQKTQHFANDIENEFSPGHPQNFSGMTGTVDKHQEDVIAGHTKPWGNRDDSGNQQRQVSVRKVGEDSLPNLSSDKGYAYQRNVVQEAGRREGMRPKEVQATSWVAQKAVKAKEPRTRKKK
jgi:hypothetical protein